ncbi:hypothetical protein QSJ19_26050 [Gordonia sp. ABSL11-1]|uniref:hypothetical protein n=1 Tax=Gordonia sp. ABSL11-1 TaxID=3053924 RepID=UPI002573E46F|nr:hypothetical protein [Gordonia sp. ABSL11-1]MDL9948980.1 hypothetical protein [Gordonia sp. ABSL11-1]
MNIERESFFLTQALVRGHVSPVEADAMRRVVPVDRDVFDDIALRLTVAPLDEGTWETASGPFLEYGRYLRTDAWRQPPLVPPEVTGAVFAAATGYRQWRPGEPRLEGHGSTAVHQVEVLTNLIQKLAGSAYNDLHQAARRVYSQVMASRIRDGFVHPVIGARVWALIDAPPPHASEDERAIQTVAELSRTWTTTTGRHQRRDLESSIAQLALQVAW